MSQYNQRRTKTSCFVALFFLFSTALVLSQDGAYQTELASRSAATFADGVYLFSAIAGEPLGIPGSDVVPPSQRVALSSADLSALIATAIGTSESVMYRLTGHPRYALRQMRYLRILPMDPRAFPAGRAVSGTQLLQSAAWVVPIVERGTADLSPGKPGRSFPERPRIVGTTRGPFLEWSVRNETNTVVVDDEWQAANLLSLEIQSIIDPDSIITVRGGVDTSTEDTALPVLDEAVYRRRFGTASPRSGIVEMVLGRTEAADVTGYVFDNVLDAIGFTRTGGKSVATFSVGTTALLQERQFPTPFTVTDSDDYDDGDPLATAKYVGLASIVFPEILGRQSLGIEVVGQIDDDTFGRLGTNDALDTAYVTANATGPTGLRSFYTAFSTVGFGRYRTGAVDQKETSIVGALAGLDWRWYAPEFAGSRVNLSIVAASGDTASSTFAGSDNPDRYTGFVGTATTTPWSAYPGGVTNTISPAVVYSIKPIDTIVLGVEAIAIGRITTQNDITVTNLDEDTDNRILGTEFGGNIGIQPSHEVKLELNSSIFLPSTTGSGFGAYRNGTDPEWRVTVDVAVRL